jgi:cell division protein FtsZ
LQSIYFFSTGTALMGIGKGTGKNRAMDAAVSAISSPLLGFPISGAKGIIFNVVGGPDMTLQEINRFLWLIVADILYFKLYVVLYIC